MTINDKVRLWDEINRYVETCGGDPSKHVYGNTRRQLAVVAVEKLFAAAMSEAAAEERARCAKVACDYAANALETVNEIPAATTARKEWEGRYLAATHVADDIRALAPAHEQGDDK